MREHQVLTGTANIGNSTISVGYIDGIAIVVYVSGCDVVILSGQFQRIQTITDLHSSNELINCLHCSEIGGKIAVGVGNEVYIVEAKWIPPAKDVSRDVASYLWEKTETLTFDSTITSLRWTRDASKLLIVNNMLQLWSLDSSQAGEECEDTDENLTWKSLWHHRTATPVRLVEFSPDDEFFATVGQDDCMVKIWYNEKVVSSHPDADTGQDTTENFCYKFIYITHPRTVTGFSWRNTSRHMGKRLVANALLTCCMDDVCRIWKETIPYTHPLEQQAQETSDRKSSSPSLNRSQQRNRNGRERRSINGSNSPLHFHIAASIHPSNDMPLLPAITPKTGVDGHRAPFVLHWLNNKELQFSISFESIMADVSEKYDSDSGLDAAGKGKKNATLSKDFLNVSGTPTFLSENEGEFSDYDGIAEEDVTDDVGIDKLLPSESTTNDDKGGKKWRRRKRKGGKKARDYFKVYRKLRGDISSQIGGSRTPSTGGSGSAVPVLNSIQIKVNELMREWRQSTDSLFCIHPKDGSLLVWLIEWLDEAIPSCYRQPHVSFSSRIPNAVPIGDSSTLSQRICIYRTDKQSITREGRFKSSLKRSKSLSAQRLNLLSRSTSVQRVDALSALYSLRNDATVDIVMLTAHSDGTMNKWHVGFADNSFYNTITSITHGSRCCGSRFHTDAVLCHPMLPLLLTVSHQRDVTDSGSSSTSIHINGSERTGTDKSNPNCSELTLWRVDCVGPMFQSGGLYELARIQSDRWYDFVAVAWLPSLLFNSPLSTPSMSLSLVSATPSACFVACDQKSIKFYQAILDAQTILAAAHDVCNQVREGHVETRKETFATLPNYVDPYFIDSIVSLQSGKQPGCILELCTLNDSKGKLSNPIFLHVFSESSLFGRTDVLPDSDIGHRADEHYFVVGLENVKTERGRTKTMLYMWRVLITTKVDSLNKQNKSEMQNRGSGIFSFSERAIESLQLSSESTVFDNTPKTPMFLSSMHTSASIQSVKVYEKELDLPLNIYACSASAASDTFVTSASHISSKPSYLILTLCSDNVTRFWSCSCLLESSQDITPNVCDPFCWYLWGDSQLSNNDAVDGNRIIDCSSNGKIACLEEINNEASYKTKWDVCLSIWECESTGSSVWVMNDSFQLSDYGLQPIPAITKSENLDATSSNQFSSLQLSWSPCEDGKFLLTVGVDSKVLIFSESLIPAYSIAELPTMSATSVVNTPKASPSVASPLTPTIWQRAASPTPTPMKQVKHSWTVIREVIVDSFPLYKQPISLNLLSWVSGGMLIMGYNKEVHVYCQWSDRSTQQRRIADISEAVAFTPTDNDNSGLFEKAWFTMPVLPQYHPHHLIELIKCGKIRRARAILAHLLKCVAGNEAAITAIGAGDDDQHLRNRQPSVESDNSLNRYFGNEKNRSVSVSSFKGINPKGDIEEERTLAFLPLPLHMLLQADKEDYKKLCKSEGEKGVDSAAGFMKLNDDFVDGTEILESSSLRSEDTSASKEHTELQRLTQLRQKSLTYFGMSQAKLLATCLAKAQLPGLTSLDQLYLLTLSEDIGSTKTEIGSISYTEREDESMPQINSPMTTSSLSGGGGGGYANVDRLSTISGADSVDDCGLRFLLAMRLHIGLERSLPPRYRKSQDKQMPTSHFAWAFHSHSIENLVALIPAIQRGDPSWEELRMVGVGWWIRSNDLLKRCMEKVARAQFNVDQNPLDCALLYLAMKKKSLVWGLFKTVQDSRMTQFFAHNFAEERWRKAALKNAYVLLGQQRFTTAAAFFLLAGSLWDAIEICINRLHDYQLCVVIARLHDGDDVNNNQALHRILNDYILGNDNNSEGVCDPFLRSIAHWWLKDYAMALKVLLDAVDSERNKTSRNQEIINPDVFYLYYYLRLHPLIKKTRYALASPSIQKPNVAMSTILHRRALSKPAKVPLRPIITETSTVSPKVDFHAGGLLSRKERRLFFAAANAHFKSGCPALALEILSLLPDTLKDGGNNRRFGAANSVVLSPAPSNLMQNDSINTGTFGTFDFNTVGRSSSENIKNNADDVDWSKPISDKANDNATDFDWSQPVSTKLEDSTAEVDWSQPVSNKLDDSAVDFDWSQPVSKKLDSSTDIDWSQPVSNKIEDSADSFDWGQPVSSKLTEDTELEASPSRPQLTITGTGSVDIEDFDNKNITQVIKDTRIEDSMLQQLKFSACLKVLLEELRALPADCEITGNTSRLKSRLLDFLKKEFDALSELCEFSSSDKISAMKSDVLDSESKEKDNNSKMEETTSEVVTVEDSAALKREIALDRKKWLLRNQKLLATLLNYCMLHGANSSGLTTIRMGLLLLLQESQSLSQQQQQRLSLIPSSEVPPLVTATLSSSPLFTNPISLIRSLTKDILLPLVQLRVPPSPDRPILSISVLLSLSTSLSSCVYQSLCCDAYDEEQGRWNTSNQPMFSLAPDGNQHYDKSSDGSYSHPNKWPGVQVLRSLLSKDNAEESTTLRVLLVECCLAIYLTLLTSAWSEHQPNQLYRLICNPLSDIMWYKVFGAGLKITPKSTQSNKPSSDVDAARRRFNYKVFQGSGENIDQKAGRYDRFIQPQISLMEYFITKSDTVDDDVDYDSEEESDNDSVISISDDYDYNDDTLNDGTQGSEKEAPDQRKYDSYSWALMNYAIIKFVYKKFQSLLSIAGIELSELPSSSLLLFNTMKMLERWQRVLLENLEAFNGPPPNFINFVVTPIQEDKSRDVAVFKYKGLLEPLNTPFSGKLKSGADRRLWRCLLKEALNVFVDHVFRSPAGSESTSQEQVNADVNTTTTQGSSTNIDEVIVLFKGADALNSFCLNNGNRNCIAVSDKEDLIELDVSPILSTDQSTWVEDHEGLINPGSGSGLNLSGSDEFVMIRTTSQASLGTNTRKQSQSILPLTTDGSESLQYGKAANMLLKRPSQLARRIDSHPQLPFYISGSQDGSIRLWEYGHSRCLSTARKPLSHASPVTGVHFTSQGNKFGATDGSGTLSLWQLRGNSSHSKPFSVLRCHKTANDFAFVGSSSFIATIGQSLDGRNLCLWDTLVSARSALVHSFICHENGSLVVAYAPTRQILITGGKRGNICIFDIRQRQLRYSFLAHEASVNCLTVDETEEFFVTGSSDGDVKVWSMASQDELCAFNGMHTRSGMFKTGGIGVTKLAVLPQGQLFSSGGDGTIKFRILPDTIVPHF